TCAIPILERAGAGAYRQGADPATSPGGPAPGGVARGRLSGCADREDLGAWGDVALAAAGVVDGAGGGANPAHRDPGAARELDGGAGRVVRHPTDWALSEPEAGIAQTSRVVGLGGLKGFSRPMRPEVCTSLREIRAAMRDVRDVRNRSGLGSRG